MNRTTFKNLDPHDRSSLPDECGGKSDLQLKPKTMYRMRLTTRTKLHWCFSG